MLKEYAHGAGGGFPGCLRDKTRAIFAELLGPGANVDEDEIDVRHLVAALKRDAPPEGDGALAAMLHLPKRIRAGDGSRDKFEIVFKEIDADRSGTIDVDEFVTYFRKLAKERVRDILEAAIVAAVKDDDDDDDDEEEEEEEENIDDDDDGGKENAAAGKKSRWAMLRRGGLRNLSSLVGASGPNHVAAAELPPPPRGSKWDVLRRAKLETQTRGG
jgi:serine/threonine-protein phosphatase 6 regulatory ankyrin repeat subunit A